jgi:hypothetical protein
MRQYAIGLHGMSTLLLTVCSHGNTAIKVLLAKELEKKRKPNKTK